MKTQLNILLGGLGLFALQGCKAPQAEQSVQPNVIYVFPDQYHALAAVAVLEQLGLCLLQNFLGQHAGPRAEIIYSCHNAPLLFPQ